MNVCCDAEGQVSEFHNKGVITTRKCFPMSHETKANSTDSNKGDTPNVSKGRAHMSMGDRLSLRIVR